MADEQYACLVARAFRAAAEAVPMSYYTGEGFKHLADLVDEGHDDQATWRAAVAALLRELAPAPGESPECEHSSVGGACLPCAVAWYDTENDRLRAELERLRVRLRAALCLPLDVDWDAIVADARSAGVVRDAEYRAHDRIADENKRLRAEVERLRSAITTLADELASARHPAGPSWLHATAARLRETLEARAREEHSDNE